MQAGDNSERFAVAADDWVGYGWCGSRGYTARAKPGYANKRSADVRLWATLVQDGRE